MTKQVQEINEIVQYARFLALLIGTKQHVVSSESTRLMYMLESRMCGIRQASEGSSTCSSGLPGLVCVPFVDIVTKMG